MTSSTAAPTVQKSSQRLGALDGIRGVAIFLVIMNHIPLGVLFGKLPSFFTPFLVILTANGKTGVSLLFLLSGFLMTWLYPQPKSKIAFWAKRYARVFPPFLVMVLSLAIIRSYKLFLPEYWQIQMRLNHWLFGEFSIPIVLGFAVIGRLLWGAGLTLKEKFPIGRKVFWLFILFQAGVALWYVFVLLRVPPAVFYQSWSQTSQMIATAVVNATLTLPFGQYIAQLDGVYWSLITELSFYLMYPVLILPLVGAIIKKKSTKLNVLILLATMPFLFGMKLLFDSVLGFGIMQFHLFIYFLAGITLALAMRTKEEWKGKVMKALPFLSHPISIVLSLAVLFSSVLLYGYIPNFYHPWVQLFLAFPIGFVLFTALSPNSSFGRWLEHPWLATLGKYSYSLYLIHSLVIEILTKGGEPTTLKDAAILTVTSFVGSLVFAKVLFFLVEQPYFQLRKAKVVPFPENKQEEKTLVKPVLPIYSFVRSRNAAIGLSLICLVFTYMAYRTLSSFFAQSIPHSNLPTRIADASPRRIPITDQTTRFEFIADNNNLGMITTSLKAGEVKDDQHQTNAASVPGEMEIRLLDSENKVLAKTDYKVHEIGESHYHPFGFPAIPDSKGKTYYLEYQIVQPDPARALEIEASDAQFRTMYFYDKKQLLKDPKAVFELGLNKLTEPFMKSSALYAMLHLAPFLALMWISIFSKRSAELEN